MTTTGMEELNPAGSLAQQAGPASVLLAGAALCFLASRRRVGCEGRGADGEAAVRSDCVHQKPP